MTKSSLLFALAAFSTALFAESAHQFDFFETAAKDHKVRMTWSKTAAPIAMAKDANFPLYRPTENSPFILGWVRDGVLLGSGVALELGGRLTKHFSEKRETVRTEFDIGLVNQFDRGSARAYSRSCDIASEVTQWIAIASPAFLLFAPLGEYATIAAMYAESVMISDGFAALCKGLVSRHRPYKYFAASPSNEKDPQSFFSGHTARSFNAAVFFSYTYAKYFPDSKLKPLVIAGSLSLATTTAVLRITSGSHFLSDVLVGALVGSLTGFFVPFIHQIGTGQKVQPKIGAGEVSILLRF